MSMRSTTVAVLTALAAVSTSASAQTYTFTQTEMGRIVPARFLTTTQAVLADVDIAAAPAVVAESAPSTSSDLALLTSDESGTWGAVVTLDDDEAESDEGGDVSFMDTGMGRTSIVGLAGIAGAGYYALRPDVTASNTLPSFDTTARPTTDRVIVTPLATVTPEPASMALMGVGLAGLALVARRRRTS